MGLGEAVELVCERNPDEFFLPRFDRLLSPERLRVYLRYLHHLGAAEVQEGSITRRFATRSTDKQWAQSLADAARVGLAPAMGVEPRDVPSALTQGAETLLKQGQAPTIPSLIQALTGAAGQDEEYVRWDLYLIADAPGSVVEIRRYPTLWIS